MIRSFFNLTCFLWGAGLENHLRGLRPPPSANAQAAAAPEVSPLEGLILYYTFQDVEGGRIEDRGPVGNHARLDGARTDGHGHTVNSGAVHFHQGDGRMGRIQRVPEITFTLAIPTLKCTRPAMNPFLDPFPRWPSSAAPWRSRRFSA